nr:UDP-N-acetylmuramoyl-tripeptide--D-alanyl-D-alanine ligase [Winogradskyella alexanderae]
MEMVELYNKFKGCINVSTDTRKLKNGSMYFALKGDNFNGNNFVEDAFNKGAKYCVVDEPSAVVNKNCILVNDALKTLQELAKFHRAKIKYPIIGLTGSNGKTTTKELIYSVLSASFKVKATSGNLNNHIGVPLTLLEFQDDLDFGIVEMGANHQKEIEFLSSISQPDYGLITNFGKAHLEGFGGVEGVIKGKSELYDYIRANQKTAIINTDDEKQINQIGNYKNIITFGSKNDNNCQIEFLNADPFVTVMFNTLKIQSQLIGAYNFGNIAVAIAIGNHFNVPKEAIKKGIEDYQPKNNRSEIIEKNSTKIILDAYNANPSSMLGALKNLKQLSAKNKMLFLGDMFELGEEAHAEHQSIVDFAETNFEKNVYLIGENFYNCGTKSSTKKFKTFDDIKSILGSIMLDNSTILIKGSRGMALERILEHI